jgi:hypothetical protein
MRNNARGAFSKPSVAIMYESQGRFAPVDGDRRTRNERTLVGGEKHHSLGDLFGRPDAFERHARD